jgi:ABC-2 type transport system permease protein
MISILKKEIFHFFSSSSAYLLIGSYLLVNILFLFTLDTQLNIFDAGYANMENFFEVSPYLFLFLIPAISMGIVAEEKKEGLHALLISHPISSVQIYIGKFLSLLILILFSVIPSIFIIFTVEHFSAESSSLDITAIAASYILLMFIASSFISIGIYSSSISKNQISALIISIFISSLIFIGFDKIADINSSQTINHILRELSIVNHTSDFSKGVLNSYDLTYFVALTLIFSFLSIYKISKSDGEKTDINTSKKLFTKIVILFAIVISSSYSVHRLDFTQDKRYTINNLSFDIVESIDEQIEITLFLTGDLPKGFKKLEEESRRISKIFSRENDKIFFHQIEEERLNKDVKLQEYMAENSMMAINLEVKKSGESQSKLVYPYLLIESKDRSIKVDLLKTRAGISPERQLNNSLENIEYAIVSGLEKLNSKKKTIGILKGHREHEDAKIADFIVKNRQFYNFVDVNLNDSLKLAERINAINGIDLLFIANPLEEFSTEEKLLIDQYIVNGGNSLWLMSGTSARKDSLFSLGRTIAIASDVKIDDLLFKYGVRINKNTVADYRCAQIKLASGRIGNNVQYHDFPWPYSPVVVTSSSHPIVKNLQALKFEFPSSIDTVKSPGIEKFVLAKSSDKSRVFGVPNLYDLSNLQRELDLDIFKDQSQILSVLLQGKFSSAFKNRILPFTPNNYKEQAELEAKMIIISDPNFASNEYQNGQYLPMGYDKWFNINYGNGEFIQNSLEYLSSEYNTLDLRKKEIKLKLLDKATISHDRSGYEFYNYIFAIIYLLILAFAFGFYRKSRYVNN